MDKQIFDFEDYKEYLLFREQTWSRGMRKALAQAIGCQAAFISQVLNDRHHFSLEQAQNANSLLGHSEEESHFFLLIVQLNRAGTDSLRKYFSDQIGKIKVQRKVLKNRVGVAQTLNLEGQLTYYSAWYYGAIHMAITIPDLQTTSAIAKKLALAAPLVASVLEFLESVGLAERQGSKYVIGKTHLHIDNESKLVSSHHTHWRMQAIQSLARTSETDLHYSSAITLSQQDVELIRENLTKAIIHNKKIIRASPPERLFGFNLDFFQL